MSPTLNATNTIKKDDLPGRKKAKKTPTAGKVAKQPRKKVATLAKNAAIVPHKKPHRFRPGTLANIEIRRYQKSDKLLIPKIAMVRLIREVIAEYGEYRLSAQALHILRQAFEDEAVTILASANRMATHAKRVTLMPSDFDAVTDVRLLCSDPAMKNTQRNDRYKAAREVRLQKERLRLAGSGRRPAALKNRVTELSTVDEQHESVNQNPAGYD